MIIQKERTNEIQAIVFDFDATLMDTEEHWFASDQRLMTEFNIEFTEEMKKQYIGRSLDDMVNGLVADYGLTVSKDEIKAKKNRYFLEAAGGNSAMFPAMKGLYAELKKLDLPMAIATGTEKSIVEQLLRENDLLDDFEFVLTAADVQHGKPAPDIYLEAANRLNLSPRHILVLEDSPYGVESALQAGAMCIAIPYLLDDALEDVFYQSHILFEKGMAELSTHHVMDWIL